MKIDKAPEVHIATFGFFTSFISEMLQMPFFDVDNHSTDNALLCKAPATTLILEMPKAKIDAKKFI